MAYAHTVNQQIYFSGWRVLYGFIVFQELVNAHELTLMPYSGISLLDFHFELFPECPFLYYLQWCEHCELRAWRILHRAVHYVLRSVYFHLIAAVW